MYFMFKKHYLMYQFCALLAIQFILHNNLSLMFTQKCLDLQVKTNENNSTFWGGNVYKS